jgi:hypothetical protein
MAGVPKGLLWFEWGKIYQNLLFGGFKTLTFDK